MNLKYGWFACDELFAVASIHHELVIGWKPWNRHESVCWAPTLKSLGKCRVHGVIIFWIRDIYLDFDNISERQNRRLST